MSTQLHEPIGMGALDDPQPLAIEGSKNSAHSRDSRSNWTETEKKRQNAAKNHPSSRTARLVKLAEVVSRFPSASCAKNRNCKLKHRLCSLLHSRCKAGRKSTSRSESTENASNSSKSHRELRHLTKNPRACTPRAAPGHRGSHCQIRRRRGNIAPCIFPSANSAHVQRK